MNVVYSSSDSFCEIAGISILTLFLNNRDADEINIFMIDNDISELNRKRLDGMAAGFGRKITYIEKINIEKLTNVQIKIGRWNISTFFRLFLPTMLPANIDKALFMDCDTIVLGSLEELWNMDMGEAWVYGVDDFRGANYRTNIGLEPDDIYINNGVLLIDLSAWRKNKVEEQFIQFIQNQNGDITYVDQGVQNGVLSRQKRSGALHPKYNCLTVFFDFMYADLIKLRKPPVPGDPAIYKEAIEYPIIVHFQSCFRSGTRPWNPGNKHPYTKAFLEYKAKSPWKNEPLRKDDRTITQKMLTFAARLMPERTMVALISFMHTQLYPAIRGIKTKPAYTGIEAGNQQMSAGEDNQ